MSYTLANANYISEGSFGKIYSVQTNRAIKVKEIDVAAEDCNIWKHEYEIHRFLYNQFENYELQFIQIVKPHIFSFSRIRGSRLNSVSEGAPYNSCYYTMERVFGLDGETESENLKRLVKSAQVRLVAKTVIPTYLYLGAIGSFHRETRGHITLDILKGVQLREFFVERLAYCDVKPNGFAMKLMAEMVAAFFQFVSAGCMPRDIEYVFNSRKDAICSILDFNQVKTLEERRGGRIDYNIEEDIAHVYIDLCGLRKNSTKNPWCDDEPTPQWRFLCSPLTAPAAFFTIWPSIPNSRRIRNYILDYAARHHLNPQRARFWKSQGPFFCPQSNEAFDKEFQEYIIDTLVANLHGVNLNELSALSFDEAAEVLQNLHTAKAYKSATDNDWGVYSPF